MDKSEATTQTPPRILIVDDHPNTAAMLARVLGKFEDPVDVLTAQSAEEAIDVIGNSTVDVLITDFMMSGMNGLDLIEKLQGDRQPAHTILITAYDTPGLKLSVKQLKINDYLVKPVQPEKIREIVGRVLKEIRPQNDSTSAVTPAQRPFKILIADDNSDNLRLLSVRLNSEGYDYITSEDGQETLDKIRSDKPDLVLLDVNMPVKDGFEVLLDMRKDPEIAHIPVIIVTAARIAAKDVREGLTLGADDYVTKPVDWRELSARIRTKLRVKQAEDALRTRNRELGVLPEISKEIGERFDVEELTSTVLARSVGALEATNGSLILFHPDGRITLQIYHMFDFSPWTVEDLQNHLSGEGLIPQVLNTRRGMVIDQVKTQEGWVRIPNDPTRSAILFPLLGRRDVLGVLILTSDSPAYFSDEHLPLIQAISSQAAIAIENAQLFAVERKRVNELVALNQIMHQVSHFTHYKEMVENIPDLVKRFLGYPVVSIWMVQDDTLRMQGLAGEENAPRSSLLEIVPQQAYAARQPVQFSGPIDERIGDRFGVGKPPVMSSIAVPIFTNAKVNGVIAVHSQKSTAFQESDRVLLETMASQIGIVGERILLFESVEKEHKRMEAVLRTAADAILVFDTLGNLQIINPAGERLFTDIRAKVGIPLPLEHGYDDFINLQQKAHDSQDLENAELRWPDGRTFSVLVAPIKEGGQVAVLHDVSHFMAINQLKNEFIATASHDLKNPIFSVLGYSDLMEKVGPLNEMQSEFLKRIRTSARNMQDLVLNLLEMARIEMESHVKREMLDLTPILKEVYEEFRVQAQNKQLKMNIQITEQPLIIKGDRIRLQQVMRNLLGNSIKYTLSDGKIGVAAAVVGSRVQIDFTDTGVGIPEEALPHLFEKFYRVYNDATQDVEGNGLGLAIVKSIVEQHGGHVAVQSKLGEGSTFSVSFPMN